jgi:hypothetical protein
MSRKLANIDVSVRHVADMSPTFPTKLVNELKEHYTVAIDLKGSLFCGIHLTWNDTLGHVDCHMSGYINKALTKYQHPKPVYPQHAPYKAAPIQYGARVQSVEVNTTQPLSPKEIKHVQDIVGTLLYYAQAVDPTFLPHSVPLQHAKATAQGQWRMRVTNSSTMLLHIPMQAFGTRRVTWY